MAIDSLGQLVKLYESIREAMDMPPPAIVQSHDTFSPRLINFIKSVENPQKKGFKNGRWHVFRVSSTELNIGYGHKVEPGEKYPNGITDEQVEAMLRKDLEIAYSRAQKYVDNKFGKGTFDNLDQIRQEMLIDYAYNLGSLNGFPKFTAAVVHNDIAGMKREYTRYATIDGVKKRIGRNDAFFDTYLKNYKGGFYMARN